MTTAPAEDLTLQDAADRLGVHYMTAYRYVRLGMLPAHKQGSTWRVRQADLASFRDEGGTGPAPAGRGRSSAQWSARLEARLLAGDTAGAWAVCEAALTAGTDVGDLYLDVIAPALVSVGERWESGEIDVADEHRASAVVTRVLSRLAPKLQRPGRTRGTIVVGGAPGETHALPVSMIADLLAGAGFDVVDLGADVPAGSFAHAAAGAERLVAVGISVTTPGHDRAVRAAVKAVKEVAPGVPVLLGGRAVVDAAHAARLGADAWAADGRTAVEVVTNLAVA